MKNFFNPKPEYPFPFHSTKSKNRPMPSQFSRSSFNNVRLAGQRVGASMIMPDGSSGESQGSCSINIYVNNDVQGINNSVLVDSKVQMGDLGVYLSFKEVKMDRGFRVARMIGESDFMRQFGWVLLISFITIITSFFAYLLM